MSGVHARLSASSTHRWLNCPGSIRLAEGVKEAPSRYAAEGTFAHSIASDCLETNVDAVAFLGREEEVEGFKFTCDQEMVDAVQVYLDSVRACMNGSRKTFAYFEVGLIEPLAKVDPDLGGTADAVVYAPEEQKLTVFDFKYGQGTYVEADDNEQMKIYALGAMLYLAGKPVQDVEVVVVQPRFEGAKPVRPWAFKAVEILDFAADVMTAAGLTRLPNPGLKAGDWCKFCKAARTCPELERKQHALVAMDFDTALPVDMNALAAALKAIPLVKERIKAIEEFAYSEATAGRAVPGFKLVEKRPSRQWNDPEAVKKWAEENAVNPYAEPELLSVAQLEKKLGEGAPRGKKKEAGKVLEPFVARVSSGTALVPETDDRPEVKRGADISDFAVVEGAAKEQPKANPLFS